MAPKSSVAAEQQDHSCPMLKLIIEKGPLSGQTLEFRPGTRVRVGRVVRGNTLSIKDAGVSSQHLLIQSESTSDSGRSHWTITDLGSSNGTVLNGSQIEASVAATLSDGDVVKIGETTAIKVKFEVNDCESEGKSGNARRYVKRRMKNKGMELGMIDENSELGLDGNDLGNRYNLRSKGANEKAGILASEDGKLGAGISEGKRTRKGTRGKSSLREGTPLEDKTKKESNLEHKDDEEERGRFEVEVDELVEEGINSGSEGIAGFASTSGVARNEDLMVDLKNMTLGDWFDFLEVYLPKQIFDTTEEMISGMRQKAEKLHEFMLEQRNA